MIDQIDTRDCYFPPKGKRRPNGFWSESSIIKYLSWMIENVTDGKWPSNKQFKEYRMSNLQKVVSVKGVAYYQKLLRLTSQNTWSRDKIIRETLKLSHDGFMPSLKKENPLMLAAMKNHDLDVKKVASILRLKHRCEDSASKSFRTEKLCQSHIEENFGIKAQLTGANDETDLVTESGVRIDVKSACLHVRKDGHSSYLFDCRKKKSDFFVCLAMNDDYTEVLHWFVVPCKDVSASNMKLYSSKNGKYWEYEDRWDLLLGDREVCK